MVPTTYEGNQETPLIFLQIRFIFFRSFVKRNSGIEGLFLGDFFEHGHDVQADSTEEIAFSMSSTNSQSHSPENEHAKIVAGRQVKSLSVGVWGE